ncbi:MAG: exodeoxyribonuclease VII large subunit [Flavobacteriales bacterium]|nr:exodeoxyribonuclease VII large subunit [Flavobacteriales bacterium]
MPEIVDNRKTFTLAEVATSIQRTLADRYTSGFWVRAEMNKLNHYSHSGHCYPELVEKQNGRVVAQFRSTLWSDRYSDINQRFLKIVGEPLKDGIKILFFAKVKFDAQYGLTLHIEDIDPSFTLGDLEKEKQESIQKLKSEGLFDRNKKHALPLLPQRLAIISVETSKGYADFLEVIDKNPWNYHFFHMLFPAILQGENAIDSILYQLSRIAKVQQHFDAVAIIRGGGGDVGLSCYNNYQLARSISTFPLPVLTGIGHATNETVCEMVSFQNAITPTKIGEFLIQKFHLFAVPVEEARDTIIREAKQLIQDQQTLLQQEARLFKAHAQGSLARMHNQLGKISHTLTSDASYAFKTEQTRLTNTIAELRKITDYRHKTNSALVEDTSTNLKKNTNTILVRHHEKLEHVSRQVDLMNPVHILKRGYSITLKNGKAIKSTTEINVGDEITTLLHAGSIISNIQKKEE